MTTLSAPGQNPLQGPDRESEIVRGLLLAQVAAGYARAMRRLVGDLQSDAASPGDFPAEALLAVSAARDIVRAAQAVASLPRLPELMQTAIRERLELLHAGSPHLKPARDVIQHLDEYVQTDGRQRGQWFDLTVQAAGDTCWVRIGRDLDVELLRLLDDCEQLAETLRKSVVVWANLDWKLDAIEVALEAVLSAAEER